MCAWIFTCLSVYFSSVRLLVRNIILTISFSYVWDCALPPRNIVLVTTLLTVCRFVARYTFLCAHHRMSSWSVMSATQPNNFSWFRVVLVVTFTRGVATINTTLLPDWVCSLRYPCQPVVFLVPILCALIILPIVFSLFLLRVIWHILYSISHSCLPAPSFRGGF
jgi:hypothetical protein